VIGGEQIYKLFLPLVENVFITLVHVRMSGDAYFPEIVASDWGCIKTLKKRYRFIDEHQTSFFILKRRVVSM